MRRKLRALVVGTGYAGQQHIDALRQLDSVEIGAIVASSSERAQAASAELGLPVSGGGLEQAIASEQVDVVHVCTPNDLHFAAAEIALGTGKHVICEKPLAANLTHARKLVELARAAPVKTVLAHNYRFFPLVAELCARINAGELGRVHLVRGHFLQDRLLRLDAHDWRIDTVRGGFSRAIADIGSHWLDLAELFADAFIDSVSARVATVFPNRHGDDVATEDQAALLLRFASGIDGALVVSQVAAGRTNEMEISVDGSGGSATWRQHAPDELWLGRADGTSEVVHRDDGALSPGARELASSPGSRNESRRNLIRLAYDVIREERSADELPEPLPGFAHGLHQLEIAAAALESARKRRWIDVPPIRWYRQ